MRVPCQCTHRVQIFPSLSNVVRKTFSIQMKAWVLCPFFFFCSCSAIGSVRHFWARRTCNYISKDSLQVKTVAHYILAFFIVACIEVRISNDTSIFAFYTILLGSGQTSQFDLQIHNQRGCTIFSICDCHWLNFLMTLSGARHHLVQKEEKRYWAGHSKDPEDVAKWSQHEQLDLVSSN